MQTIIYHKDNEKRNQVEQYLLTQYKLARLMTGLPNSVELIPEALKIIGETLEWNFGVFLEINPQTGLITNYYTWQKADSLFKFATIEPSEILSEVNNLTPRQHQLEIMPVCSDNIALEPTGRFYFKEFAVLEDFPFALAVLSRCKAIPKMALPSRCYSLGRILVKPHCQIPALEL